MSLTSPPAPASIGRRTRASALLALPFVVGCVALAVVLTLIGFDVQPLIVVLLILSLAVPMLVELVLRTSIPWPLQLHYLIFIIAGPFAGSALNVYSAIPRWDALVHYDSGIMLAWLGMLAVRRAEERTAVILPRWFELTVVQLMPMAFAGAWEICEFLSDQLIGTVSQADLADTMNDIILGTLGGLTAIVILVLLRRPRTLLPLSFVSDRSSEA